MSSARHDWKDGDRAEVIIEGTIHGGAYVKIQSPEVNGWTLPVACLSHPLPTDPHAAEKRAVVEAARVWGEDGNFTNKCRLLTAVNALNAAMAPPDPWEEIRAATAELLYEIKHLSPRQEDGSRWAKVNEATLERVCAAIKAISAVQATRRGEQS